MKPNPPTFKDLFSGHATDYSRFRPKYPTRLFEYLASLTSAHERVWDCGTGNGQAATRLAEFFQHVFATDPSSKQLQSAVRHPKVVYEVGPAEVSGLADQSVDLVTVAQAFHWFKHDLFFAEAKRVLKPGGILAFWCYELAKISPEIDSIVLDLYRGELGAYWEPERNLVEDGYRHVQMPLREIQPPPIEMSAEWDLEHWVGYLGTWSALQKYISKNGRNPLEAVYPQLRAAWGNVSTRTVRWELSIRVGQKIEGFT